MQPQTTAEEARRVLGKAADYITRRGWCQHEWFDIQDRACIGGAIHTFAPSPEIEREAHRLVMEVVGQRWDVWQDAPGRTKTEVLDALGQAAQALALAVI